MSPDERDNDSVPEISYAEMDEVAAGRLMMELEENVEIARELVTQITGEDEPGLVPYKAEGTVRVQSMALSHQAAKDRMVALLQKPLERRATAIRFLKALLVLLERRTTLDPRMVTNNLQYVRETVQLLDRIRQLASQLKIVENIIQSSLKTNEEGVAECTPHNTGVLHNGLAIATGAVRGMTGKQSILPGTVNPADTAYMEPDQSVVNLFVKLKGAQDRINGTRELAEIYDLFQSHLRGMLEKTGLSVEIDTRYCVTQFTRLTKDVAESSVQTEAATREGRLVPAQVAQDWEDSLQQLSYVLVQLVSRTEALYFPNAIEFLRLVDLEALEQQFAEAKQRDREITRQKVALLKIAESPVRRLNQTLSRVFQSDSANTPSLNNLTAKQKVLRDRIMELVRAMEARRRLI